MTTNQKYRQGLNFAGRDYTLGTVESQPDSLRSFVSKADVYENLPYQVQFEEQLFKETPLPFDPYECPKNSISSGDLDYGYVKSIQRGYQSHNELSPFYFGLGDERVLQKKIPFSNKFINDEIDAKTVNEEQLRFKYGYNGSNSRVLPGSQSLAQYAPNDLIQSTARGGRRSGRYAGFQSQKYD